MESISYQPSSDLLAQYGLLPTGAVGGLLYRNGEKATKKVPLRTLSLARPPEIHLTLSLYDHTFCQVFRGVVRDEAEFIRVLQQVGWAQPESASAFTTRCLQLLVGKSQVLKGHAPVCENISYLPLSTFEADVLSVSSAGLYWEFEVKISRADFLADKKKGLHWGIAKQKLYEAAAAATTPNYFAYVCPPGLIQAAELPDYAGLYYGSGDQLTEIKRPIRLHNHRHDLATLRDKINRLTAERKFLGCSLLTHKNRQLATS